MDQTTNKPVLLISADTDTKKFIKAMSKTRKILRIGSILCIVCGTLFTIGGYAMTEKLTSFSRDTDVMFAYAALAMGVISILLGLLVPLLLKKSMVATAQKQKMDVYEDHIEGHATRTSGTTQIQTDFYETYDRISSVSTTETHISVNLKDGGVVCCVALNARDMAEIIRAKTV